MAARWCWAQPLGQPLTLIVISCTRGSSMPISSTASRRAYPAPWEDVMPILQLSVPGQATTSAMRPASAVPRPAAAGAAAKGGGGGSAAHPPHDRGETAELLRRKVAHGDGDRDGDVALLLLAADVRIQPALELRRRLVTVARRLAGRRALGGELGERFHVQRLL